jgi:hypothetical protein
MPASASIASAINSALNLCGARNCRAPSTPTPSVTLAWISAIVATFDEEQADNAIKYIRLRRLAR